MKSIKATKKYLSSLLPTPSDSPKLKLESHQKDLRNKQILLADKLESIKYTKKNLKSTWTSYLALKENKTRNEIQKRFQQLNELVSIRNLEHQLLLNETNYLNPSNEISIELTQNEETNPTLIAKDLFNDITNAISSLIKLEKEISQISQNILKTAEKSLRSERTLTNWSSHKIEEKASLPIPFIQNCLSAPETLETLVKQYKNMTFLGKIFRPIFFSLPKNIHDYISQKNIINPLENEQIKNALHALNRTSKICRILQISTFCLIYIIAVAKRCLSNGESFFSVFLDLLKSTPLIFLAYLLFVLLIPALVLLDTLITREKKMLVSIINRTPDALIVATAFTFSLIFLSLFDIQRSSYLKNFDTISEQLKEKEKID